MESKGISPYTLMEQYGVSTALMSRMKNDMYVSEHSLERICKILDCLVEDVIEIWNG